MASTVRLRHVQRTNDWTHFFYDGSLPVHEGVIEVPADKPEWVKAAWIRGFRNDPEGNELRTFDEVMATAVESAESAEDQTPSDTTDASTDPVIDSGDPVVVVDDHDATDVAINPDDDNPAVTDPTGEGVLRVDGDGDVVLDPDIEPGDGVGEQLPPPDAGSPEDPDDRGQPVPDDGLRGSEPAGDVRIPVDGVVGGFSDGVAADPGRDRPAGRAVRRSGAR